MIDVDQNTGVLFRPARPRDWLAGGVSGITFEIRKEDGQWDDFLVEREIQVGTYFDSLNCTGFATLNAIEIQQKFLTGVEINYSDMFVGGTDGLTDIGNYAVAPPDAIRKYGLVLETDYAWNRKDPGFTRHDYQAMPPQDILDKGKFWLDYWTLRYEEVDNSPVPMKYHLRQSPLNVISRVCSGWNDAPVIQGCGFGSGHEYTIYGFKEGEYWKAFDHYDNIKKKLAWNYNFAYVLKNLLTKKLPNTMSPQAQKYLIDHDKQFVLAVPSGRNGYIKNMEVQEIQPDSRAALAAIAYIREHGGGGGVPDNLYDEFPNRPF